MSTRSTKPPIGAVNQDTATVTAMPVASARKKKSTTMESDTVIDAIFTPEEIARLKHRIAQLPDIDAARIVELHDRIISGEYDVDSAAVAEKIQKFEAEL